MDTYEAAANGGRSYGENTTRLWLAVARIGHDVDSRDVKLEALNNELRDVAAMRYHEIASFQRLPAANLACLSEERE